MPHFLESQRVLLLVAHHDYGDDDDDEDDGVSLLSSASLKLVASVSE